MSENSVPWIVSSSSKSSSFSCLKKYSFSGVNIFKKDPCEKAESSDEHSSSALQTSNRLGDQFQPAKVLKQGPKKVQKAMNGFAASFDQLSQRLRRSTRRRYRLTDSPFSPNTPGYRSRLCSSNCDASARHRHGSNDVTSRRRGGATSSSGKSPMVTSDDETGCLYTPFMIDSPTTRHRQQAVNSQTPRRRINNSKSVVSGAGSDNYAMDFSPCQSSTSSRILANISNTVGCGGDTALMAMMDGIPATSNKHKKRLPRAGIKKASSSSSSYKTDSSDVAGTQFYSPTRRLRVDVCQAENTGKEFISAAERISSSTLPYTSHS